MTNTTMNHFLIPSGEKPQSTVIAGSTKCGKTSILFEAIAEMLIEGKKVNYISRDIFFPEVDSHLMPAMHRLLSHVDADNREVLIKRLNTNLIVCQSLDLFVSERESGGMEGVLFCDGTLRPSDGSPQEVLGKLMHLQETTGLSYVVVLQTRADVSGELTYDQSDLIKGMDTVIMLDRKDQSIVRLTKIQGSDKGSVFEFNLNK